MGDYLEQVFPVLGIRYIAVNSNYDSKKYCGTTMGLDIQVNNLVNHLYSRDISKKLKSALQTKWRQGKSTAGRIPFGYKKSKDAPGGWEIDEEAAAIVRVIFEKAAEGVRTKAIAEYLNENKYVTPGVHRERNNEHFGRRIVPDDEALWDTGKVRYILGKYEYTGAFVHHLRENVRVGSNITRKVPDHERIITEDAHVAIVTKEEYKAAQDAVRLIRKVDYRNSASYLLRGKVRCGNCHLVMARAELACCGGFYCAHKVKTGEHSNCCEGFVSEKMLERYVFVALRQQLQQIKAVEEQSEHLDGSEDKERKRQQKALATEIDKKQAERVRQYIAYAEGVIKLEKYLAVKEQLTQEIEELQAQARAIGELEQESHDLSRESKQLFEKAKNSADEEKLTKEMVDEFIDTVYVFDADHVEIAFSFEDCLKRLDTIKKGE